MFQQQCVRIYRSITKSNVIYQGSDFWLPCTFFCRNKKRWNSRLWFRFASLFVFAKTKWWNSPYPRHDGRSGGLLSPSSWNHGLHLAYQEMYNSIRLEARYAKSSVVPLVNRFVLFSIPYHSSYFYALSFTLRLWCPMMCWQLCCVPVFSLQFSFGYIDHDPHISVCTFASRLSSLSLSFWFRWVSLLITGP